jgi:transposase-like protein
VTSKHFRNAALREWWSVHVEAWRRSGLSQRAYCRHHRLTETTFSRWLKVLVGEKALRAKAELDREERRERRRRRRVRVPRDRRCQATQAFWAMHVEALIWSGMSVSHYAATLHLSPHSLRRWRDLLDADEVQVDWRAHLHPSARPNISTSAKASAKDGSAESLLTGPAAEPAGPRRRRFGVEEKRAIVLESEAPGETVSAVARRHGIVASMLFRWRAQLGFGAKDAVNLAPVRVVGAPGDRGADGLVLHDLLPIPDGMAAVDLADGRRVFAPAGADPIAVRRHVAEREARS